MITGAIAIVFIIAAIGLASNGEWEAFAVAVVIVLFFLALGAAGREDDRAYLNWTHYWATGEPLWKNERKRGESQRAGHVSRRERQEAAEKRRRYAEELVQRQSGNSGNIQVRGSSGVIRCPMCESIADEYGRTVRQSGTVFVNYRCRKCGRTWPVKIK